MVRQIPDISPWPQLLDQAFTRSQRHRRKCYRPLRLASSPNHFRRQTIYRLQLGRLNSGSFYPLTVFNRKPNRLRPKIDWANKRLAIIHAAFKDLPAVRKITGAEDGELYPDQKGDRIANGL